MQVFLESFTPDALNLLLKTKNTRLAHNSDPATWSDEERKEHLSYMRDTIKSSWEFVDYVFRIEGVTRAFTHQLVRTRTGSYAQEAMRVIDASGHEVMEPPLVSEDPMAHAIWEATVSAIRAGYSDLLALGKAPQDARGLLPTNITTSIFCKFNLRTLSETAKLRLCTRTQGEYQDVFRAMSQLVIGVHPWAEDFLQVHCVAMGTCAFPRYGKKECPVYDPAMDVSALQERTKQKFWSVRHESSPIAKNGKAC